MPFQSEPIARPRRFAIALFSLCLAAACFHSQIAAELCARGDTALVAGRAADAQTYYARAIWLDPNSAEAIDRYVFAALQTHDRTRILRAESLAGEFLSRHGPNAQVSADRGYCRLLRRAYAAALGDFLAAATVTGDPQAYTFAGWAARRGGEERRARLLFRLALRANSRYRPALIALSR